MKVRNATMNFTIYPHLILIIIIFSNLFLIIQRTTSNISLIYNFLCHQHWFWCTAFGIDSPLNNFLFIIFKFLPQWNIIEIHRWSIFRLTLVTCLALNSVFYSARYPSNRSRKYLRVWCVIKVHLIDFNFGIIIRCFRCVAILNWVFGICLMPNMS